MLCLLLLYPPIMRLALNAFVAYRGLGGGARPSCGRAAGEDGEPGGAAVGIDEEVGRSRGRVGSGAGAARNGSGKSKERKIEMKSFGANWG